jgi:hypothetical protein
MIPQHCVFCYSLTFISQAMAVLAQKTAWMQIIKQKLFPSHFSGTIQCLGLFTLLCSAIFYAFLIS